MLLIARFLLVTLFFNNFALADEANLKDLQISEQFITKLSSEAIEIIKNNNISEDKKFETLKNKFLDNVDVEWISKFVLGPIYRTLSSEQQKQFFELYQEFLVNAYVPKFKEFNQDTIKVEGSSQVSQNRYKVSTIIDRDGKPDIRVDYMVKPSHSKVGTLQIYDIVAEDVSMISTHRSEFTSVISQKGFEGMIDYLKATNSKKQ